MTSLAWTLLIAVLASAASRVAGQDTSFFFNGFSSGDLGNLQLSGDTTITTKGTLDLTKHASNSVGHAFYGPEIRLVDHATSAVASFSTNFSFLIKAQSEQRGEGLAFVLLGSKTSIRHASGGAFLGVFGSDGAQVTKTLAVEFDTFKNAKVGNVKIHDINANHVGLDLDVIRSKIQVDAGTVGIFLADGSTITSWIDYTASTSTIEVRISLESAGRPINPLLSYKVDLSSVLRGSEFVWIGFSAATRYDCVEYHTIRSWGFSSWGLPRFWPPVPPPPTPSNGGPLSAPTSTPASPPPSPPGPTPWHTGPVSPPISSPTVPPSWHGEPVSPRTSPPAGSPPPDSPSHGDPVSPPTSTPGSPPPSLPSTPSHSPVSPPTSSPTVPPSWHGEPVSPRTSPPAGSPPPDSPSHGGPVSPPTSTPGSPPPSLPPTPSHSPVSPPTSSPTVPPSWHGEPVSPPTSPPQGSPPPAPPAHGGPVTPPTPTPWHGDPVTPPTPTPAHGDPVTPPTPTPSRRGPVLSPTPDPWHGGPILPPISRPPHSPPDSHPEHWAIPLALGLALVLGLFLLFCWRKHHHRPPPPPPPPRDSSSSSCSSLPHPGSPPMSPDHPEPHGPPHSHHGPPLAVWEEVIIIETQQF